MKAALSTKHLTDKFRSFGLLDFGRQVNEWLAEVILGSFGYVATSGV